MKGIILAAGYATRLYPLTLDKPKPLLLIAGKPMIEYILDKMAPIAELDEIFVITNNKFFTHFQKWSEDYTYDKKITIINDKSTSDDDKLGALGDIQFVIDTGKVADDILIIAGDNLFEDDLTRMHAFFKEKQASTVAFKDVKDIEVAKRLGIGAVDNNMKITSFVEKPEQPPSTFAATLVYFLRKEDLHLIKSCMDEEKLKAEVKAGEFIAYMITKTDVYGYVFEQPWVDIGDKQELQEADRIYREKQ